MPERPQQRGRMAAERHDAARRPQALSARNRTPAKRPASTSSAVDGGVEAELDAELGGTRRQLLREQMAVAGFVVRQAQAAAAAAPSRARVPARRARAHRAPSNSNGTPSSLQHGDVACRRVELRLAAKQLQRAQAALLVRQMPASARSSRSTSRLYSASAHHALLVHRVALRSCIARACTAIQRNWRSEPSGRMRSGA